MRLKLYGKNRSLGLLKIPEAAYGQRGWLVNNSQFSDAMTTLLFEFPSDTLPEFLARLSAPEEDEVLNGIGLSLDRETKELALHALNATTVADADAAEDSAGDVAAPEAAKPPPVGVLMSIEWTAATFSHKNEVGDLRQFIRPVTTIPPPHRYLIKSRNLINVTVRHDPHVEDGSELLPPFMLTVRAPI